MGGISFRWLAVSICAVAVDVAAAAGAALLLDAPGELLDPQSAFRISARPLGGQKVEVEFKIAEGYYMYRHRFSFAAESGEPLAAVEIPNGKFKEDAFFGRTETFRDRVRIRMSVSPRDAAAGSVTLKVTSQGCADAKVCYAPLEQIVKVQLR